MKTSNYKLGYCYERELVLEFKKNNYWVMRVPASKSPIDLLVDFDGEMVGIQVKSRKKYEDAFNKDGYPKKDILEAMKKIYEAILKKELPKWLTYVIAVRIRDKKKSSHKWYYLFVNEYYRYKNI
jgi:hypothetical protein